MSETRIKFNNESLPIATLMSKIVAFKNQIGNDRLDLQPSYQRGAVWSQDFKDKLIFSILSRYPVGSVIIRNLAERNCKGADTEVVDGQQRLTTIYEFTQGEFSINDDLSKRIIKDNVESYEYDIKNNKGKDTEAIKLYKKYLKGQKVFLTYSTLASLMKSDFDSYNMALTYISHQDDNVIAEYFRFVQNQERLRAGEIINSIPDSQLEQYLLRVNSKNILVKLSWEDKRKEFDKLFYAAIGIFEEKLPMGGIDADIIEYVKNSQGITGIALNRTNLLISQLESLAADNTWKFSSGINKRFVKFLFMLSGYGFVNFAENTKKKLNQLYIVNKKLSAFSSAKATALDEEFKGYTDEQIEKYRLIALISKGSQKWDMVEERMKLLANLMEGVVI